MVKMGKKIEDKHICPLCGKEQMYYCETWVCPKCDASQVWDMWWDYQVKKGHIKLE